MHKLRHKEKKILGYRTATLCYVWFLNFPRFVFFGFKPPVSKGFSFMPSMELFFSRVSNFFDNRKCSELHFRFGPAEKNS